jgi:hypothetical protein
VFPHTPSITTNHTNNHEPGCVVRLVRVVANSIGNGVVVITFFLPFQCEYARLRLCGLAQPLAAYRQQEVLYVRIKKGSPLSVLRSPFSVLRSPFSVLRSPLAHCSLYYLFCPDLVPVVIPRVRVITMAQ